MSTLDKNGLGLGHLVTFESNFTRSASDDDVDDDDDEDDGDGKW